MTDSRAAGPFTGTVSRSHRHCASINRTLSPHGFSFAASRLRDPNKEILTNDNLDGYDHPTSRCCDDRLNPGNTCR